jgi:hypothetical protein
MVVAVTLTGFAQNKASKTAQDLEGNWSFAILTPLERPAEPAG